ncbi:hypothetical protein D3C81_1428030 [compost metagenome]
MCIKCRQWLACAVAAGQLEGAGVAFTALLQKAEFGVQVRRIGLPNEAEPAVQQSVYFLCTGVCAEFELDVPEHLPGEGIQHFSLESLQPTALVQCMQPGARPAVAQAGNQQLQCSFGTRGQVFMGEYQGCVRVRQGRWRCLWRAFAEGKQTGVVPAKLFELIQRLRPT